MQRNTKETGSTVSAKHEGMGVGCERKKTEIVLAPSFLAIILCTKKSGEQSILVITVHEIFATP